MEEANVDIKNKLDIVELRGEIKLLRQEVDTVKNNHIWHLQKSIDGINKVLWTVGFMVLAQFLWVIKTVIMGSETSMATSGTYTFNLDTGEIIQEAYERCGVETKSGYDLKTARRSLNLLLTKWVNDGVNLFTLDLETTNMTKDQGFVTFNSTSHLDVLDAAIRDNSDSSATSDIILERISMDEYLAIPSKLNTGKPVQYAVERNSQFTSSASATHKVYLWPVPDQTYYQFLSWSIKYPQDVSATYTQNPDIPRRYLPALVSGLAVELAVKKAPDRLAVLKPLYDQDWEKAREEDRERVSFHVQPQVY